MESIEERRLARRYWKSRGLEWRSLAFPELWRHCLEAILDETRGMVFAGLYRYRQKGNGEGRTKPKERNARGVREGASAMHAERLVLILRFERPLPAQKKRELELTLIRLLRPQGGTLLSVLLLRSGDLMDPGMAGEMVSGRMRADERSRRKAASGVSRQSRPAYPITSMKALTEKTAFPAPGSP